MRCCIDWRKIINMVPVPASYSVKLHMCVEGVLRKMIQIAIKYKFVSGSQSKWTENLLRNTRTSWHPLSCNVVEVARFNSALGTDKTYNRLRLASDSKVLHKFVTYKIFKINCFNCQMCRVTQFRQVSKLPQLFNLFK